MQKKRLDKFHAVVNRRQPDLTVVLENVTDMHNIGAVIRTADSVGVGEIYILNTDAHLQTEFVKIGKRTSMGSGKWVEAHYFTDAEACFERLRSKYDKVLGAMLGEGVSDFHHIDLTEPLALFFGNEHRGISAVSQPLLDGKFMIPQVGMAESLNISVACAVTLYEAFRQRNTKGFYEEPYRLNETERKALFDVYFEKHKARDRRAVKSWKQE
ncbi:MAG: RNA methyltransferase [Saprospiraceae bacterium]|nr:RNA methyltransferase [Saprospiraceae bacterium]MCF8280229.1 RNA methyltransferase [Bacteroidales bacterium]